MAQLVCHLYGFNYYAFRALAGYDLRNVNPVTSLFKTIVNRLKACAGHPRQFFRQCPGVAHRGG